LEGLVNPGEALAYPQFFLILARRGGRWMRNPCAKSSPESTGFASAKEGGIEGVLGNLG
jgi:hypothetical protein